MEERIKQAKDEVARRKGYKDWEDMESCTIDVHLREPAVAMRLLVGFMEEVAGHLACPEPAEPTRSCFTCVHSSVCFAYRKLNSFAPIVNVSESSPPGKWEDVVNAMGQCCFEYKRRA